jgi:hypothetical protein
MNTATEHLLHDCRSSSSLVDSISHQLRRESVGYCLPFGGIICRFLLFLLPKRHSHHRVDSQDGNREIFLSQVPRRETLRPRGSSSAAHLSIGN